MYKKILIPLDGSELSECALGHARLIAKGCSVPEVILFKVVEHLHELNTDWGGLSPNMLKDAEKKAKADAEAYIAKVAADLNKEGIAAKGVMVMGDPADEIMNYAQKNKVDLIIMATHGRSGPSRVAFGSVANRVVHYSLTPILVATAPSCRIG